MAQGIKERFDSPEEETRLGHEHAAANLRVAIPGIIQSFNEKQQTATVQPAITENIRIGQGGAKPIQLPLLTDVPVFFPRAGGYCLTFPVKAGDECILIFSDMCIDGWWQSGGVCDQVETRRHDLSDAQAFLGITSVPRAVTGYSTNSLMLRNESKDSYFEIVDDSKTINIIGAENLNINVMGNLAITTTGDTNINTSGNTTIKTSNSTDIISDGTVNIKGSTINLN